MTKRCRGTEGWYINKYYFDKGVTYSEEWKRSENFRDDMYANYLQHVEEFGLVNTSIDRIDVNGNYCKENCRWATKEIQATNRTTNIFIEYNGETDNLSHWCQKLDLNYEPVRRKVKRGKNLQEIIDSGLHKGYHGTYGTNV
jgi:hypothetical protein